MKRKTILMIGCFDTKAEDFTYLYSCLTKLDVKVISINTGVRGTTTNFPITIEAEVLANVILHLLIPKLLVLLLK